MKICKTDQNTQDGIKFNESERNKCCGIRMQVKISQNNQQLFSL